MTPTALDRPPEVPDPPSGEPFDALYRRLLPRIYGYVASLLRDNAAAEDVTAAAFERAYRRRASFRPSRGTAEAWVFGIADRRRGFVLSSSVATGEGPGGGSFDLRVPVEALAPTLRDLSTLGEVRARSQSGEDVTGSFATVEDRLDGARAERHALLRRLEQAEGNSAIRTLRRRLDLASAEVRGLQGEIGRLRERTDYASVSVSLTADDAEAAGPIDDAWDDFLASLAAALALGLRSLGVLVPLAAVGVPAWLGIRALRRRRREAVLS